MKYDELAAKETVKKTSDVLQAKGYEVIVVKTSAEALTKIKELIPNGVSVVNGSSVTLEQIGYLDYLASG